MDALEPTPPTPPSPKINFRDTRQILKLIKHWISAHTGEILWAFVFALLVGYGYTVYTEDPKPYKIYVVADPDINSETLSKNFQFQEQKPRVAKIGDVDVKVQIEMLADQDMETSRKKAEELLARPDTLLVIEHGRSQHIQNSLRTYMAGRPQVPVIATVATEDDLLNQCNESCFDEGWFAPVRTGDDRFLPLLQLSPTNEVQGRSAVQFASQKNKHRFLVISSDDPINRSYSENMVKAYSDAIAASQAELVGVRKMDNLPNEYYMKTSKPDCVLYVGGLGEAEVLFNRLSGMRLAGVDLMVILSDSVIESRGTDSNLAAFVPPSPANPDLPQQAGVPIIQAARVDHMAGGIWAASDQPHTIPVEFTYQADASDYNSHTSGYAEDAFSIALQLIQDLNERGGDLRFRIKSFLHMHNVKDARRNLVEIMQQNSMSRTWYRSASGRPYVFKGHKQYGGMFHVWRLKENPEQPGSEMEDIDNWHPPKSPGH
jgi:hypothetical protein